MLGILSPIGEAVHLALVEKGKWTGKVVGNEFLYYCVFHEDTNKPNMYVNYEKGKFYCFRCGAGGSLEHLYAFLHALPALPLNPYSYLTPYTYWRDIWENQTEGIEEQELEALSRQRKISIEVLQQAEVRRLNGGIDKDEPASLLKGYYLFPSYDQSKKLLLSFVGYNPNSKKKYMNPSGLKLAPFGFHLLNGDNGEPLFVVEGIFDALTFSENGRGAVALLGVGQSENLVYLTPGRQVILLPDFDEAGKTASVKWAFEALLAGFYDAEVWLPTDAALEYGKDANDIWRRSKEAFMDLLEGKLTVSRNVCEYLVDTYREQGKPLCPVLDAIALCAPFPVYADIVHRLGEKHQGEEIIDRLSKLYLSSLPFKKIFTACKREVSLFLLALRSIKGRQIVLEYFLPHEIAPFNKVREISESEMVLPVEPGKLRAAIRRLARMVRSWAGSSLDELASIYATQGLVEDIQKGGVEYENSLERLMFAFQDLEEQPTCPPQPLEEFECG